MDAPQTRYASTPHGDIAYQTIGDGPLDLLIVHPMSRCLDTLWDYAPHADMLMRLAQSCRLILFDRRGCGISDPLPADLPPTWEDWLEDILAVLDATAARDVVLLAERDAASASMLFASGHPERVRALILCNTSARFRVAPGYPCGEKHERAVQLSAQWEDLWGTERMVTSTRPSLANDPAYVRWATRMQRAAYSPRRAGAEFRYIINFDARAVLTAIRAPTLILHRRDFAVVPVAHGRYLAERIRGARLEVLPGSDLDVLLPGDEQPLELIEAFLAEARHARSDGRVLATVLLAEIAEANKLAERLGNAQWSVLRDRHRSIVQDELVHFQGRDAVENDDGVLASFDGPARALRFAQALQQSMRKQLQIEIKVGLHTGECERTGSVLSGAAVQIGSALRHLAQPGEVLVSAEVRDLTVGSGIGFRSRGAHQLDGVAGERELFALDG